LRRRSAFQPHRQTHLQLSPSINPPDLPSSPASDLRLPPGFPASP
jgi:hypothetical protein